MKSLVMTLAVLFMATGAFAQPDNKRGEDKKGERPSIEEAQFNRICQGLKLTDEKAERLKVVYTAFQEELKSDKFRPIRLEENATEEQIDEMLKARFEAGTHIAKVRADYYTKFRKILSASETMQMFQIERRIKEKLENEMQRRQAKPGEGKPGEGRQEKGGPKKGGNPEKGGNHKKGDNPQKGDNSEK